MQHLMKPALMALAACLALLLPAGASAQKDTAKDFTMGLYYTLPLEFPHIDYSELNEALASAGYPAAKRAAIIVGLGAQWHVNRSILSITYNQTSRSPEIDTADVTTRYRSFAFSYGYDLIRHVHYSLYPYIGLKLSSTNYLFNGKVPDSIYTTFGQYLQTNLDHKQINNQVPHLDLGLGISYNWFFMVNARAGFLVPLDDATWQMNGGKVRLEESPGIRYQYYISLTLGLGTIYSEREMPQRNLRRRNTQADMPLTMSAGF
jgi:hypothetical protein